MMILQSPLLLTDAHQNISNPLSIKLEFAESSSCFDGNTADQLNSNSYSNWN